MDETQFSIDQSIDFRLIQSKELRRKIVSTYAEKNAHFSETYARACGYIGSKARALLIDDYINGKMKGLILVTGRSPEKKSGLLQRAIRITEMHRKNNRSDYYYIKSDIAGSLGIEANTFSIGYRRVDDKHLGSLTKTLSKGKGFHHFNARLDRSILPYQLRK